MPGRLSPDSDNESTDMEGTLNAEVEEAMKKCRELEQDRNAYTQESHNDIRKQKAEIAQLEEEKKIILKNLRLTESRSNQVKDSSNTSTLKALAQSLEEIEREIKEEKEQTTELDAVYMELQKKKKLQMKALGGTQGAAESNVQTNRRIRVLENRLDQTLKTFNAILTENQGLRSEIESLRLQQERFYSLETAADSELQNQRRSISDKMEESARFYENGVECRQKIMLLGERASKDKQQHQGEMKELIRLIDHDRKLREFMGIKGKDRPEDERMREWRRNKIAEAERKKLAEEDSLETYEAAMEKIKQITNEENEEVLVQRFLETEEQNFALFNYVREKHDEEVTIREDIDKKQIEIHKFEKEGVNLESERKVILKKLEDKHKRAAREAEDSEKKLKECKKILDQLRAGVDSLFEKLNCDSRNIEDLLDAQRGVEDSNLLQYLGIIEERSNELLLLKLYVAEKDPNYDDRSVPGLLGKGPAPAATVLPVMPPSIGDEIESESEWGDEEGRPHTYEELSKVVMQTVRKREAQARKDVYKYDLSTRDQGKKKGKTR